MAHGSSFHRTLAALFAAVLTLYSVAWMYYIRQEPSVTFGMATDFRPLNQALVVRDARPGGPADRAGLKAGDWIVAVEGRGLEDLTPFHDVRRMGEPGRAVWFTVERDGVRRDVQIAPVRPRGAGDGELSTGAQFFLEQVLSLYPLPFLLVGLVVLLQRPDDRHAWLLAAMLGGFITAAPLFDVEFRLPALLRGPMFATWSLLDPALPVVMYYFFSVFPASSPLDRRVPWLKTAALVLVALATVALSLACLVTGGSWPLHALGQWLAPGETAARAALWIYSGGFVGLAVVSLALNAFGPRDVRRKTRVILFGTVVGLAPIMAIQAVLSVTQTPPRALPFWLFGVAVVSLFLIPLSLGYAVVKHRAMEIPVLLRRSARYVLVRRGLVTLATLAGLAVTAAFALAFSRFFSGLGTNATTASVVAGSAFGVVLALSGRQIARPFLDRIDRSFFRGAYDARQILQQVADQSRTVTDRRTLAHLLDEALTQALHPRLLWVYLRSDEGDRLEPASGDPGRPAEPLPAEAAPLLPRLLAEGRPMLLSSFDLRPGSEWAAFAPLAPEGLVPMAGRLGQLEGLLVLGSRLSDEPYSGEDVALLASVAAQAGLALENIRLAESMARRLEVERRSARELEIAKEVQAKLLPQARPALASLDYAGACIQARQVGGDYYDFIELGPQRLGLVLADISGKGISAALLMASLQANLRAQYLHAPDDLGRALHVVNRIFHDSTATNHYATLFFGVYDETSRQLRYANCGHLPPVLLRSTGEVERLSSTAPVVGMFLEPWSCETGETTLGPDDLLVVFTDGLSDAINAAGEEFGEDRLVELLHRHRGADPSCLLDLLVREVLAFGGSDQFDDLTLIVARGRALQAT